MFHVETYLCSVVAYIPCVLHHLAAYCLVLICLLCLGLGYERRIVRMRIIYGGVNDLKQAGFLSLMLFIDQCSFFYNVVVYKIAPKYSCAFLFLHV